MAFLYGLGVTIVTAAFVLLAVAIDSIAETLIH